MVVIMIIIKYIIFFRGREKLKNKQFRIYRIVIFIKPNFKPSLYAFSSDFSPFFIPIINEYISINMRLIKELMLSLIGNIKLIIVRKKVKINMNIINL